MRTYPQPWRRGGDFAGKSDGGRPIAGVANAAAEVDMTDYHAELETNEARLRDLLATLELCTVMARDFNGTIRFWSSGCERLYGWTAGEAIGRSSHELLRTVFPEPLPEIEKVLLREGEWTGDLVHTKKNGEIVVVASRKVVRRDGGGNPSAVMESVADVTALRLAEEELRRLNTDLERRVLEETKARGKIQSRLAQAEKLTALGQLAGGVAHDFNNFVQAVSGVASSIARHAEKPEFVRRWAGMLEEEASRGAAITERLLSFARRDKLRPEEIDVAAMLEGLHEMLVRTLGSRGVLRLILPESLPPALVDRRQLETVLINLATNARDAIGDQGCVTFSACREFIAEASHPSGLTPGDYIRFDVSDDGVGMDEVTVRRAMEPFFTTKEHGKGTGLGLSMASGFAEQSDGALAIESRIGFGTTVSLWLPTTRAAAPEAQRGA